MKLLEIKNCGECPFVSIHKICGKKEALGMHLTDLRDIHPQCPLDDAPRIIEHNGCRFDLSHIPEGAELVSIKYQDRTGITEVVPLQKESNDRKNDCTHPGCKSGHHVTHPCEVCGRIAGQPPEDG